MPSASNALKPPRPIPVIVGATGAGKTAAARLLAEQLGADVISADSRQVYKHVSVGTAKPEGVWEGGVYRADGVAYHLADILQPTEIFSAGDFARRAEKILKDLEAARRPAVIAGGTGLYLRALVDGLAPLPPKDDDLRKRLSTRADNLGRPALHAELARVDPEAAKSIPPNNIARLIRALEIYELTGTPISRWQKEKTKPSPRVFQWLGLRWPREVYEEHLKIRCERMLQSGMIEETKALLERGTPPDAPLFQSLGYRDVISFLQKKITREALGAALYSQTRLYAKRQMTWFRANPRIQWFDVDGPGGVAAAAERLADAARARL